MKALILDAGPIINLSMNGLLYILEGLKKKTKCKLIITKDVLREVYERPITIRKFELGAVRVKELIDKKILELPESIGINSQQLEQETQRLNNEANHTVKVSGHFVKIVSRGEMSSIACSVLCSKLNINNLLAIDERTARIIYEKPENLEKLMTKKLHKKVRIVDDISKKHQNLRFIRSPELVYAAYKMGLTKMKNEKALEAMLYATKFKGASISFEEIEILKNL